MKRLFASLVLAIVSAIGVSAPASAKDMAFRVAEIRDPHGFERPMTAATLLLPADWTTSGGIEYRPNAKGPTNTFSATSPDGLSGLGFVPNFCLLAANQYTRDPRQYGCEVRRAETAVDAIRFLVEFLPNGRIVSINRDPQQVRLVRQNNFAIPGDPYMTYSYDIAEAVVTFTDKGREFTGIISIITSHNFMRSGQSTAYMVGAQPLEMWATQSLSVVSYAAPTEHFDEGIYRLAMANLRYDPNWSGRVAKVMAQMRGDDMRTAAAISRIQSETSGQILDMQMDGYLNRQRSNDRSNKRFTDVVIREVETVTTTSGQQVSVPIGAGGVVVQAPNGTIYRTQNPGAVQGGVILKPVY